MVRDQAEEPIRLKGQFKVKWKPFSKLPVEKNGEFKYMHVQISPQERDNRQVAAQFIQTSDAQSSREWVTGGEKVRDHRLSERHRVEKTGNFVFLNS
ncbi:hypothetical protein J2S00_000162 [Caldalkalibacillus uzonensis]|uniref:Uncharacterized protein n=1 Tax=Caldalkalibacillus uzonensis TaxID=353224 RepID=A0ABU0CML7_9BACI|nr:hypothetical protein [Caldalkalibacillus uzonensis]MDQ0337392.1 hypothetical protein [Caldalkalibacillus uzonensis]